MFSRISFWLKCARAYTLPISIFSWLIIFVYGYKQNGNLLNGIIALLGICLCHLSTNLLDDYFDFKSLKKTSVNGKSSLLNAQNEKCEFLLDNSTTPKEILKIVGIYLTIATIIGGYFISIIGVKVTIFMATAGILVLTYSFLSKIRLSELAVGLIYGPILFGGTYLVMTGHMNTTSIILSIPSTIFVLNIIYTDTLMDYDIDKAENKKTFVGLFSKRTAQYIRIALLTLGYLSAFKINPFILLTTPLAVELLLSNDNFKKTIIQARNLMVWNSCLLALAIIL